MEGDEAGEELVRVRAALRSARESIAERDLLLLEMRAGLKKFREERVALDSDRRLLQERLETMSECVMKSENTRIVYHAYSATVTTVAVALVLYIWIRHGEPW